MDNEDFMEGTIVLIHEGKVVATGGRGTLAFGSIIEPSREISLVEFQKEYEGTMEIISMSPWMEELIEQEKRRKQYFSLMTLCEEEKKAPDMRQDINHFLRRGKRW